MENSHAPGNKHVAALACLSLCMLLSALGISIPNMALPALASAFNGSFRQVQWIVLAYLLSVTTLVVSVGRLGDAIGRKRLLLAGIMLFTFASALCGVVSTLPLLIAARAAQGIGAAVMMALTMAMVGDAVPKARTGSAMGLLGAMSAIGTALGPSLGGVLIAGLGWRSIFLANVPIGLVALGLAHRHLADDRNANAAAARFDIAGTVLLGFALAAYAFGVTTHRGNLDSHGAALLLAAALGAWMFVLVERKVKSPLIPLAMLRNAPLAGGLAMNALVSTVMMATLVVGPFHLSLALGLDTTLVGLVLSIGPAVVALTGVPAGRIADRFGASRVLVAGLFAMACGSFALFVVPTTLGVPGYAGPIVVITLGYAAFQAANNTAVMSEIAQAQRGVVSGMLNLSRNLGLVTGASVMGAIFAAASGSTELTTALPAAVARGMQVTFGVAAVLAVIAIAIAVRSRTDAARFGGVDASALTSQLRPSTDER